MAQLRNRDFSGSDTSSLWTSSLTIFVFLCGTQQSDVEKLIKMQQDLSVWEFHAESKIQMGFRPQWHYLSGATPCASAFEIVVLDS